jgi:hypothetical protein
MPPKKEIKKPPRPPIKPVENCGCGNGGGSCSIKK